MLVSTPIDVGCVAAGPVTTGTLWAVKERTDLGAHTHLEDGHASDWNNEAFSGVAFHIALI